MVYFLGGRRLTTLSYIAHGYYHWTCGPVENISFVCKVYIHFCTVYMYGSWDSVVGIATWYGLDGPGIVSR
jgi:hypothetical protein